MTKLRTVLSVLACCLLCVGCSLGAGNGQDGREKTVPVSLEIRCDTVFQNPDLLPEELQEILPADGILLAAQEYMVAEGDTAFDLLRTVCTDRKLVLETAGTAKNAYVRGIAGLREFTVGPLSGWQYYVNGSYMQISCGSYTLQPGDRVVFAYTCDMGKDLQQ